MVPKTTPHIGTLREKPLHASLKSWYAREGDLIEAPVRGFVIDLVRDDLLIEIQTAGFSSLKRKLALLLASGHRVRIVHPIAVDKWIVKVDHDGMVLPRRLSPKHGSVTNLFAELVSFPAFVTETPLEIDVILTREEEYRRRTEMRSWRRQGWSVTERRLVAVLDSMLISGASDLVALLPAGLPERFSTADLADVLGCPRRTAQQMAYCLRHTGVITMVGKRGNAIVYAITD